MVGPEQRDAAFERRALGRQRIQRIPRHLDLALKLLPRHDAAVALYAVVEEIGHDAKTENRSDDVAKAVAKFGKDQHRANESQTGGGVNPCDSAGFLGFAQVASG